MLRKVIIFSILFLAGTFAPNVLHTLAPTWIAPDFIVILVIYLGVHYRSYWGVIGSFLLGLASDFSSAQFLGPNAAGSIFAFLVVVNIADKVYAERGIAVSILAFLATLAKAATYAVMLALYAKVYIFTWSTFKLVVLEALFTGLIAPLLLWALRSSHLSFFSSPSALESGRRSRR